MRAPVAGVVGRTRCVAAGVRSCAGVSQSCPNPAALCRDHPHASTSPHQCQRQSSQRLFSTCNTPLAGQASFATVGPAAVPQSESLAPGTGAQSRTTPGTVGCCSCPPVAGTENTVVGALPDASTTAYIPDTPSAAAEAPSCQSANTCSTASSTYSPVCPQAPIATRTSCSTAYMDDSP